MADPGQDSLFREIDKDLRQEQYAKLWTSYGRYVIGAAAALIIGVGGYQGWRHYDVTIRTEESNRFEQAIVAAESGALDAAREAFALLAEDAGHGYRFLARLRQAALRARQGDRAGAVAIYEDLAADDGIDTDYRHLAVILAALHLVDSADPTALGARLEPLAANDNPWRHSARELLAMLAERIGDREKARDLYTRLAVDSTAPRGLRERAKELLAILDRQDS